MGPHPQGQGQVKVRSQIVYFLVNASPPKLMGIATSNFAGA